MIAKDLLSLAGTRWFLEEIREGLLKKLYYSLPLEEQNKILLEVIKDISVTKDVCHNCGKTIEDVKNEL